MKNIEHFLRSWAFAPASLSVVIGAYCLFHNILPLEFQWIPRGQEWMGGAFASMSIFQIQVWGFALSLVAFFLFLALLLGVFRYRNWYWAGIITLWIMIAASIYKGDRFLEATQILGMGDLWQWVMNYEILAGILLLLILVLFAPFVSDRSKGWLLVLSGLVVGIYFLPRTQVVITPVLTAYNQAVGTYGANLVLWGIQGMIVFALAILWLGWRWWRSHRARKALQRQLRESENQEAFLLSILTPKHLGIILDHQSMVLPQLFERTLRIKGEAGLFDLYSTLMGMASESGESGNQKMTVAEALQQGMRKYFGKDQEAIDRLSRAIFAKYTEGKSSSASLVADPNLTIDPGRQETGKREEPTPLSIPVAPPPPPVPDNEEDPGTIKLPREVVAASLQGGNRT